MLILLISIVAYYANSFNVSIANIHLQILRYGPCCVSSKSILPRLALSDCIIISNIDYVNKASEKIDIVIDEHRTLIYYTPYGV